MCISFEIMQPVQNKFYKKMPLLQNLHNSRVVIWFKRTCHSFEIIALEIVVLGLEFARFISSRLIWLQILVFHLKRFQLAPVYMHLRSVQHRNAKVEIFVFDPGIIAFHWKRCLCLRISVISLRWLHP